MLDQCNKQTIITSLSDIQLLYYIEYLSLCLLIFAIIYFNILGDRTSLDRDKVIGRCEINKYYFLNIGPHIPIEKEKSLWLLNYLRLARVIFFQGQFSLAWWSYPPPNLPRTYEKLHYKGEPYLFSGQRDPSIQAGRDPVTFI